MKKVAVLIREKEQQYEGLRTSLGALLENVQVQMIVLDHEIENMHKAYQENMEFLDEMEGERYSDNPTNVKKYGFLPISHQEIGNLLRAADVVIPF